MPVDPKYSGLPGIVWDQPDTFETNENDQAPGGNEDLEKTAPEKLHLSSLSWIDNLEVGVEENEKETLMQRFLRLRCEVGELVEELDSMTESSRDEGGNNEGLSIQVKSLERQLEACNFETDGSVSTRGNDGSLQSLRTQIESLRAMNPKEQDKINGVYRVFVGADKEKTDSVDLAKLDARLAQLEKVVGPDCITERNLLSSSTDNKDLSSCIGILDGRKTFLNQQHVDHIEGRLSALNFKMNSISEQKGAIESANKDEKLNRLATLISGQSSQAVTLLPELIERLEAVSELQDRSQTWSDLLGNIEQQQRETHDVLTDTSSSVKTTRNFIDKNVDNILQKSQDLQAKINTF